MAESRQMNVLDHAIARALLVWALPGIAQLSSDEWREALQRARAIEFETIERIGLVAGVPLTAYLLRFDVEQLAALSLPARYCIQFLAAVPLLAVFVGPFYLRRLRRGLEQEIRRRRGFHPPDLQR